VADDYNNAQEDEPLTVNAAQGVLSNDTDANNDDNLTASLDTDAKNGSVTLNKDGSFTYTPNKDFFGIDTFSYVANDGTADSAPATVTITVANVADAPVAMDDFSSVEEDTSKDINVVANDTDPDGFNDLDPASVTIKTDPGKGTAVANNDGTVTYTPNKDANGADSFSYEVCDKGATPQCDEANVDVQITPASDGTIARPDEYEVNENGVLNVDAPGNDEDPDGPLTATTTREPDNGTLVLRPDGSFTYTPNANFSGNDFFFYRANDTNPEESGDETSVSINVLPVDEEEPPPPADPAACNDGRDNDGDGKRDLRDPGCENRSDDSERNRAPEPNPDQPRCTIKGNDRANTLRGTSKRDVICGMGGNDTIMGMGGNDLILGNAGNDTIQGGSGDDTIYGGDGEDTIQGNDGNDRIYGGSKGDVLQGNDGRDTIRGGAGDDTIQGGAGDDDIDGGAGNDTTQQ